MIGRSRGGGGAAAAAAFNWLAVCVSLCVSGDTRRARHTSLLRCYGYRRFEVRAWTHTQQRWWGVGTTRDDGTTERDVRKERTFTPSNREKRRNNKGTRGEGRRGGGWLVGMEAKPKVKGPTVERGETKAKEPLGGLVGHDAATLLGHKITLL